MSPLELLAELHRRGIRLWADAGRLRYEAPKGALTEDLRAEIAGRKAELLAELVGGAKPGASSPDPLTPARRGGALPLSFGQQRLWFLDQLLPDDLAYNVPASVRLEGELDIEALRRAVDEVVRRHETLRSRFPSEGGKATLVIEPHAPLTIEVESLEHLPEAERLTEATRRARADAVKPFDLAAGPVFRVRLYRMGPGDHVLHIVMHHIVSDGWSIGVLFRELAALYGAFVEGKPSPLADLTIQYADFAAWQQAYLEKRGLDGDLAWWRERLGGGLPVLELPADRPRRTKTSRRGAYEWFPIDPALLGDLNRLAQREGMTDFQVMLAAFFVLLAKHSSQEDIVIGTPIAARSRREVEGLIGFFVNNLVLRCDLSGDPTFRELLTRVRAIVLDAFSHQETPFEKIVEAVSPERDLGRNPIFQVLFNHFDGSEVAFELPPLVMSPLDMTLDVSKFDLTLHCFEKDGKRYVKFEYDTDLFDLETIRGFGERYLTILRGVVADPARPVSRLPLVADAERRRLLVEWNRTDGEPPPATSVHALFEERARRTPNAPALVFEKEILTYAELDARASALARRLVKLGVKPEDRVALFLGRSAELIVGLLAVLKAGGAYVPIDPNVPVDRAAHVLADAGCRAILTTRALAKELPASKAAVLPVDAPGETADPRAPLPAVRPGQLAYVIYTSGSTGRPKGVEVEHAQVLHYLTGVVPRLDVPASSHYASVSTLAADLGNTAIFPALCGGGCLHLLSDERIGDGDAFAAYFREHAVDVLKIVPSHLEALLAAAAEPAAVLPRKLLVLGGEACTWSLVDRVKSLTPGLEILNHYGPAETTVGALTHRISPGDRERFPLGPPIGRPLAGTRLYIVDKHGGPVPVGAAGELWIGGGGVSRGYRNLPDLTAERFLADPFRRGAEGRVYRTGDRARYARDGSVLFLGRDDDQVKIRGFRVELGEVKACLERHPKVSAAAVLARQDPLGVKRLVAYVAPRDGAAPEAAELRAHVKANLPDYMTPSAFVPVAAIPLTANGKVDRRALPDPGFDRDALREAYVPPRTPAEEVLVKIWCDVLRIERVGVHDNFFELGGESILSIQIVSRANQAGVRLKPRDVFERPTIAELAAASGELEARQAEQGAVSGEVPLTPIQRRYFDADLANPAHYNHALLFAAGKRLDSEVLRKALTALEAHHDVLRARYERSAEGWRQRIEPPAARDPLEAHDLSSLTPAKAKSELEALCAEAQRRLDLVRGPLWRAVHFRLPGGEERLLLAIHHLAVDGVSWRLLVEDLTQACAELEAGRAASLPPKTSSFKAWAEHLTARSAEAPTLKSAPWWVARLEGGAAAIPLDREAAPGVNIAANAEFLDVSLDEALTAQLLREPPRAYRAQIHEVLLTALARAFEPWTGSPRIAVDLEGHGREDLFDDLDISRTVGWFTSIHPVVLDLAGAAAPGDALCAVKETLRAVPHRGLDYGLLRRLSPETEDVRRLRALAPPSVGFNYLGHFEESVKGGGLLTIAPEFPGAAMDPANPRRYLFDVGGSIRGGRLHLTWTYCAKLHRRSTVEALAKRALEALAEIARHCASPGAGRRTPSDFPLADLRQEELTRLEARYAEAGLEDVYPMSPLQRGMVFHSLAEPGSPTYVTQLALTLHGDLSAGDFRTAWQAALDANPILRTAFVTGPHAMHQVVCRKPKLRWAHEDWSATPPDEQRARLERQALDDRAAGFDLADPPLMRLRLLRLAKDRHRFLWTHHHALLDGWSLPLLVREVFQAYTSRGKRPLEPRRPFVEYIRWLSRQDPQRAEKHWRAVLSDFGEPTPLPWSGVKPDAGAAPARGVLGEDLSPAATATLTALARREHVTLNTIVQGAWALLLARHAGLDDVLFGVTVSGRPPDLPGVETMLGLFINTLPLRVKVDDAPLVKYLAAVQAQLVELQQLQSSPLYEVQGFAPGRGGRPLFESLVVFENYPIAVSEPVESSGLRIEDAVDVSHATYPLALVVQPRQALHFELRYDARRFDAASIRRVLAHLRTLLEAMGARPEARLPQLQVLGEEERRRQVETWNLTLTDYPRDATVPSLFEARARATPRAEAAVYGSETLTYADLDARANGIAAALGARGVKPGDLVAVGLERGVSMVAAFLGILKAGAAYLPLDLDDPVKRLTFLLHDSGARCLLVDAKTADRLPEFEGERLRIEEAPSADRAPAAPDVKATDVAYVIYTSGSTGIPKGTRIPHRAITRLVLDTNYVNLGPADRVAQAANPSFDAATFEIWGPLLNGGCAVGIDKRTALTPSAFAAALREQRVTVLFVTTALFNQLVRHAPDAFATLRFLLFGGEAVSPGYVRQVLEKGRPGHLLHVYGPTECTTFSTFYEVKEVAEDDATVPIGLSIANSTAYVLDRDRQLTPAGAPGELYLGGDGLALGYHGRPELTSEKFVPDPFSREPGARLYRTGDLVRQRLDGAIEFLGRIDQQVKIRGFRVELGEIEEALRRRPGVKEAVVVCREDAAGEKQLAAYVAPLAGDSLDRDALRAALAETLPGFMVPAAFVVLPELPLTPTGKIDKRALPSPEGRQVSAAYAAPRSELEQRIAALWRDVLGVDRVGLRDNFFDLGGHSLKLVSMHARLTAELGSTLTITDLFQHTTVEALAGALRVSLGGGEEPVKSEPLARRRTAGAGAPRQGVDALAVVGMAGRFPGAGDVATFWKNLCGGVESVRFFTDEELAAAGIPEELLRHPKYVKARAILDEPDRFDARFFGYSPREAELMDPQQRVFLECAWEACESAGCDPERYPGAIGVFGGASVNTYVQNLQSRPELFAAAGGMAALISSLNDFLTTRVSYKLNLRGPSVNIQTACSTSLVAIHEACQSLLRGQCDMALAGGVSVTNPLKSGYIHEESGVRSSDGHCRTFDARAEGMVSGNAVAIVVLKRLTDAVADGDAIHAVVKGTAINNDGARKIGFTAPSIEGQAQVIADAQAAAGVEPASVGFVECHGTATALGDPIEVKALTRVFREGTQAKGFCALASLKSNMGHLDAAAGVAGLLKAVLAVKHGLVPPSLHYESPNPEIDFASSPFFVNTELRPWKGVGGAPRRAGVSAFGIGGTNAHVVVEEALRQAESGPSRPYQLLQLSAKTPAALDAMTSRLAAHAAACPELSLADAAHTLRAGRRELEHRRAVVVKDWTEAIAALEGRLPERRFTGRAAEVKPSVAFLFPGQGSQYPGMARGLYESEPVFRAALDACFAVLEEREGLDLKAALFPEAGANGETSTRLTRTSLAQPALFAVEHALAQLWISFGVKPSVTLGHSIGELVSACLAGVLTLEDAVRLAAVRGRLMEAMPEGVMLAVPLTEEALAARIRGRQGLWISGVNGPSTCVVGGAPEAAEAFARGLAAEGVETTRLHTSHAFHSGLMDGAVAPFVAELRKVKLSPPREPYVSTLTGDYVKPEDAVSPEYWGRQLREPVRYGAGAARLLEDPSRILLELGPGSALGSLARAQANCGPGRVVLSSLRHARAADDDGAVLLSALGRYWTAGGHFDAAGFARGEQRRKVELPTYPFERERYWVERRADAEPAARQALDDWFYAPVWRASRLPARRSGAAGSVLLVGDGGAFDARLAASLEAAGARVVPGRAHSLDDARSLVRACAGGDGPWTVVHAWNVSNGTAAEEAERGFLHGMHVARALGEAEGAAPVRIVHLTTGVASVRGGEAIRPEKALALGLCRVASLEHPNLACRLVDLDASELAGEGLTAAAKSAAAEILSSATDAVAAWRGGRRFVEAFAPAPLAADGGAPGLLREGAPCLITGGFGGVGLALARALYTAVKAKLVLVGRTALPARDAWAGILASSGANDPVARRIRGVKSLEDMGAEVLTLAADVADVRSMTAAVAAARQRFGPIRGLVHAAGVPPSGLLLLKDAVKAQAVLAPKVAGTRVLFGLLAGELDVAVLCSSLNAVKGFPGASDYAAANAFLDAFARSYEGRPAVVSVAWNRWRESGMAVDAAGGPLARSQGISDAEGMEVLRRILTHAPGPHVLVSEHDLRSVLRGAAAASKESAGAVEAAAPSSPSETHTRPALATEFVAPSTELERAIAAAWEELLGVRPVGVHDNFFELGGHSLLAMRVLNRLSQVRSGVKLPLRAVFDAPTVSGLARRIEEAAAPAAGAVPGVKAPKDVALESLDPETVAKLSDDEVEELLRRLTEGGGAPS